MLTKYILYACPTGPLATQIQSYFELAKSRFSPNPAMDYMPHCSLTGFFRDDDSALPVYLEAIGETLEQESYAIPDPVMKVTGTFYRSDFHGLTLQSDWLIYFTILFASKADTTTRNEAIRMKDWLHLSFAYQFKPEENEGLKALAQEKINPNATHGWELRFYERHADKSWDCHGCWSLCPDQHMGERIMNTAPCLDSAVGPY